MNLGILDRNQSAARREAESAFAAITRPKDDPPAQAVVVLDASAGVRKRQRR